MRFVRSKTFGASSADSGRLKHCFFVLCSVRPLKQFFSRCRAPGYKILGWSALWCWSGLCLWATARSEINDDLQPQLKRYPSVLHMDRMITVEYEEEARFFPQRLILRIASIAAMFHNSRRVGEPPNSFFWTLTPDVDVYPEMLLVPSATGLLWLDGRTNLF